MFTTYDATRRNTRHKILIKNHPQEIAAFFLFFIVVCSVKGMVMLTDFRHTSPPFSFRLALKLSYGKHHFYVLNKLSCFIISKYTVFNVHANVLNKKNVLNFIIFKYRVIKACSMCLMRVLCS